jgi:hypothetical protein
MAQKRKRVPLRESGLKRLQEPTGLDHKRYVYRWVNDSPGRIAAAKDGGYTPVSTSEKKAGESLSNDHSVVGDRNTGQRTVFMKIPRELYEEDQIAHEKRNERIDQSIARQEFDGKSIDEVYTPKGGGIKSVIKHTTE